MGGGISAWDVSSGTGSCNTCGGCEAVEDPGCTGAGDAQALAVILLLMNH